MSLDEQFRSAAEDGRKELKDTLSCLLLACQTNKGPAIRNGDDLREAIQKIQDQTKEEGEILLQIYRAFMRVKPELLPTLCELSEILVIGFLKTDIRPGLIALKGITPDLVLEIVEEKYSTAQSEVAAPHLPDTVLADTKLLINEVQALLPDGKPLTEEGSTRSFSRKRVKAILDVGHLKVELADLKDELNIIKGKLKEDKTNTEKNNLILQNISNLEKHSFTLLEDIVQRLGELEKTKNSKKEHSQALKDFAGKIISALLNLEIEESKNLENLAKLLRYIGNIDLLALVVNMKKAEDVRAVIEEIKAQRPELTRWIDEDSIRLARAATYFEKGAISMNEIVEENTDKKQRNERFQKALEDCASLIAIGLCAKTEQRQSSPCKARIKKYLEQIEVDAQGLEAGGLNEDAVALEGMIKHIEATIADESERDRAIKALRLTKAKGSLGSAEANRLAADESRREAEKAKNEGFKGFGDLNGFLDELGD